MGDPLVPFSHPLSRMQSSRNSPWITRSHLRKLDVDSSRNRPSFRGIPLACRALFVRTRYPILTIATRILSKFAEQGKDDDRGCSVAVLAKETPVRGFIEDRWFTSVVVRSCSS